LIFTFGMLDTALIVVTAVGWLRLATAALAATAAVASAASGNNNLRELIQTPFVTPAST
jgi:hypothetical protein